MSYSLGHLLIKQPWLWFSIAALGIVTGLLFYSDVALNADAALPGVIVLVVGWIYHKQHTRSL